MLRRHKSVGPEVGPAMLHSAAPGDDILPLCRAVTGLQAVSQPGWRVVGRHVDSGVNLLTQISSDRPARLKQHPFPIPQGQGALRYEQPVMLSSATSAVTLRNCGERYCAPVVWVVCAFLLELPVPCRHGKEDRGTFEDIFPDQSDLQLPVASVS
jgi:hypothetical protein